MNKLPSNVHVITGEEQKQKDSFVHQELYVQYLVMGSMIFGI